MAATSVITPTRALGELPHMSDTEFEYFRTFIYEAAGIDLVVSKIDMVRARLFKRLRHFELGSFQEYIALLNTGSVSSEKQVMIDLLTTNETYFFREPTHFEVLRDVILKDQQSNTPYRVWCGAASTGEEPYTLGMVLANKLGLTAASRWEVFASDINTEVLATARAGHYSMHRTDGIPKAFLREYCLKGRGVHENTLLIKKELAQKVRFQQINLINNLPDIGMFDTIFLRNVLIYFDDKTKISIIKRMMRTLKPGGYFVVGHSESLKMACGGMDLIQPTVYRKKHE